MKALLAAAILLLAMPAVAQSPTTEFVRQVLEPTGGWILRPKNWFYSEAHRESVYVWTLSREDARGNRPYTTGVRIAMFVGVNKETGKTARQFISDFVDTKKKAGVTVLKTCKESDQGLFTQMCLETEEGPYRILYSLFWGTKGLDIAVVSTAGTAKELWDIYAPTFNRMSALEIIDMSRFGK